MKFLSKMIRLFKKKSILDKYWHTSDENTEVTLTIYDYDKDIVVKSIKYVI